MIAETPTVSATCLSLMPFDEIFISIVSIYISIYRRLHVSNSSHALSNVGAGAVPADAPGRALRSGQAASVAPRSFRPQEVPGFAVGVVEAGLGIGAAAEEEAGAAEKGFERKDVPSVLGD